ncbi:MAG: hypothetical protein IJ335_08180, partial [Lachnospiraceae bacterium]|nr:hypothetical protein [Lachnospiraceae bacterium]
MKSKIIFLLCTIACTCCLAGCSSEKTLCSAYSVSENYSWLEDARSIAHGFGEIDGYTVTNCLEAFEKNYALGHRFFEVDFMLTSEQVAVAGHDWYSFYLITGRTIPESEIAPALSLEEFRQSRIYEKYTPLTLTQVIELMSLYPDIYLITDTKDTVDPMITDTFTQIVNAATEIDPTILDRIIPQIYNNEMYHIIYELYPWNSVIYTLYNQGMEFSYDDVFDFAFSKDIKVFTTFPARSDPEFINKVHATDGYVYMHTFNDTETVRNYIYSHGICGVYTDSLEPLEIEQTFHRAIANKYGKIFLYSDAE